jgi:hypothetical protein
MTPSELNSLIDQAFDAFWDVIAKRFPEATTGDLSPWTTKRLDAVAREAVEEWIFANVPTKQHD